ncbi:hypothetical protein [Youxingia wuxianensis]|uniref:Uncharacterized protein n=1 Tax=Youxingia wuxianensis TaxID=2763678 RepID=A0A926EPK1_9FIRM|nr:hypothetical protein [Youxingia wuxianensis]MBC8584004.1 hypothetical protein [Youxingia wuxianensis]
MCDERTGRQTIEGLKECVCNMDKAAAQLEHGLISSDYAPYVREIRQNIEKLYSYLK